MPRMCAAIRGRTALLVAGLAAGAVDEARRHHSHGRVQRFGGLRGRSQTSSMAGIHDPSGLVQYYGWQPSAAIHRLSPLRATNRHRRCAVLPPRAPVCGLPRHRTRTRTLTRTSTAGEQPAIITKFEQRLRSTVPHGNESHVRHHTDSTYLYDNYLRTPSRALLRLRQLLPSGPLLTHCELFAL
jgi:hypothetical protein